MRIKQDLPAYIAPQGQAAKKDDFLPKTFVEFIENLSLKSLDP
jgi:hypothetical protein